MFKFLRKYSKYILAVFGTLLLVTFLIPFAFTQLLQGMGQGRAAWAHVGEKQKKVTVTERARLQRELQLLQYLAPQLQSLEELNRAEYWYLLVREAEQAGLVGAPALVARSETEAQQLQTLAAISGESMPFIRSTLARLQGVLRMQNLYLDPDKYSDRRLKQQAQRMFHRATVQPVVIEASAEGVEADFTEAELEAQMRQYAEVAPGEGEMGFGYRLPHRAKLEWLVIPAGSVRAMIEASDRVNPVALRKHWRRYSDRLGTPEPGAEIPESVRRDLVDELTAETLDEIARDASDELRLHRRDLARSGGYFVIPPGWKGLSLQTLALSIQEDRGIALPEYHAAGDRWLTEEDIAGLDGIGAATTDKFGSTLLGLADLVMAARELAGSSTIPVQQGIAAPPLRDADGSVYLIRITDADASRPPASLDEVRDAVVQDLRRRTHYRELVGSAESIRMLAVEEGLLAVALRHDTSVANRVSVSLGFPVNFPVIGADEAAAETIIDHAMSLPRDRRVSGLPAADRTLAIPVESSLCLLVVQIADQTPLTEETYRSYMQFGLIQSRLASEELADTGLGDAFTFEALAARHNFNLVQPEVAPTDEPQDDGRAAGEATEQTDRVARGG